MLNPECRQRLVEILRSSSTTARCSSRLSPYQPLHRKGQCRTLTTTPILSSHIGSAPLSVPASVDFSVTSVLPSSYLNRGTRRAPAPKVQIKGPLGELAYALPPGVKVDYNDVARKAVVSVENADVREQRAMWGTTRAYLSNHILGVSEGHTTILRLVGVGYRATIEKSALTVSPTYTGQQFVSLKVGYSHPIELGVPLGVKASTPQPTRILLEGVEKEVVKEFAAKIRKWRVPEPYKGKGIFVDDETIKLKAKKIK